MSHNHHYKTALIALVAATLLLGQQASFARPFARGHAPVGAFRATLPIAAAAVVVAGITYFIVDGIYYRRGPGGYRVVEAPVAQPINVQPQAAPMYVTVQVSSLNVRAEPQADSPVIAQVGSGGSVAGPRQCSPVVLRAVAEWAIRLGNDEIYGTKPTGPAGLSHLDSVSPDAKTCHGMVAGPLDSALFVSNLF